MSEATLLRAIGIHEKDRALVAHLSDESDLSSGHRALCASGSQAGGNERGSKS
jgi:hypothetical protein